MKLKIHSKWIFSIQNNPNLIRTTKKPIQTAIKSKPKKYSITWSVPLKKI